jgi:hypothetical protein
MVPERSHAQGQPLAASPPDQGRCDPREALHDTNEGFDVELPDDYSSIRLGILGPGLMTACADAMGGLSAEEPYAWWLGWGLE